MKKIKFIVAVTLCVTILSSCLNIEEKIVINNDNSGAYSLSIDMSKLLQSLAAMGQTADSAYKDKKIDSVIALKGYIDTAKELTPEEKALYRDAILAVKIDMPDNIMKVKVSCPFANLTNLGIVKKNLFTVIGKLDVTKAAENSLTQGSSGLPQGTDLGSASKSGSPLAQYFTFLAAPGNISYTINDKAALTKELASDSLAQVKQMAMFMSDFSYNTTFVLPRAAKKFSGPGSSISDDKKTITFKRNFNDLISDNPEILEYKIDY